MEIYLDWFFLNTAGVLLYTVLILGELNITG
jgi:hypothetical protein